MADISCNLRLLTYLEEKKGTGDKLDDAQNENGVSLVEMLAVIVVIAIICAIALVQFGAATPQFKRQNVAQELKSAFERARFDSVKRRAETVGEWARVTVASGSFTLVTDHNQNGSITDSADSAVTNFSTQGVTITALGSNSTVYFNKRGEVVDAAGDLIDVSPTFLVCNSSCSSMSNANNSNANIVLVTPSGTVNILPGSVPAPTFAPPAISNVSTNSQIKNDVIINGN